MVNYFAKLKIEPTFNLSKDLLERNYMVLQQTFHPDMAKNSVSKEFFTATISDINKGYKILKDDIKRAEHILQILHIEVKSIKDTKLLNKITHDLEQLEASNNIDHLKKLLHSKQQQKNVLIKILSAAFTNQDYKLASNYVSILKLVSKVISRIQSKINSLQRLS